MDYDEKIAYATTVKDKGNPLFKEGNCKAQQTSTDVPSNLWRIHHQHDAR